jgi:N-acetylneuraminate lyase
MKPLLPGLVAAPFTAFKANGDVAYDAISPHARMLARNGVIGAFICGTTGEGSSLTINERKEIAETWMATRPEKLSVIVHVGHLSQRESIGLAAHAQQCRATAIATIAPSFFKPASIGELVDWCAEVAAAAPKLPFYYYHMPAMTGVTLSATSFLERAHGRIPNLAGVKFTHEDLMDFSTATRVAGGKYEILFGRDEILLAGLSVGARGAVGSTYNYAAPLFHRVMRAYATGKPAAARREQARVQEFIGVIHRHGGLSAGKAAMKLIGLDLGPTRLPLRTLTPEQEKTLRAELKAIGFFEYACKV